MEIIKENFEISEYPTFFKKTCEIIFKDENYIFETSIESEVKSFGKRMYIHIRQKHYGYK